MSELFQFGKQFVTPKNAFLAGQLARKFGPDLLRAGRDLVFKKGKGKKRKRSGRAFQDDSSVDEPTSFGPVVQGIGPMTKNVHFKACATILIDGDASGASKDTILSMNSLFDPFGASSASQPTGFDQQMAFYLKYKVYKSRIFLRLRNEHTIPLHVGLMPDRQVAAIANTVRWETFCEFPRMRTKLVGKEDTAGQPSMISLSKTSMIRPIANERLNDDFAGLVGTSPTTQTHWHIMISTIDGSALPADAAFAIVELHMWAKLYDRVNLAVS